MKLLRLILIFFVIYFIRRFFQAYQALKISHQEQAAELNRQKVREQQQSDTKVVDAEYKVVDR